MTTLEAIAATAPDVALCCPICGADTFKPYRNRQSARCAGCGALERTRIMSMAINAVGVGDVDGEIYHFAPELALAKKFHGKFKSRYVPCDLVPDYYAFDFCPVKQFNLCTDAKALASNSLAAVIHSHVLEHVICNVSSVIRELNRALKPGGVHLLCVPLFSKYYREDLSPEISDEERIRLFGQEDHVRSFGTEDFEGLFFDLFQGFRRVDMSEQLRGEDMQRAGAQGRWLTGLNSHVPLCFVKEG